MKVVIPMSGMSRRFMDAGYTVPKYLLEIDGKTVIEHIIDLYPKNTDNPIINANINDMKKKANDLYEALKPN